MKKQDEYIEVNLTAMTKNLELVKKGNIRQFLLPSKQAI